MMKVNQSNRGMGKFRDLAKDLLTYAFSVNPLDS